MGEEEAKVVQEEVEAQVEVLDMVELLVSRANRFGTWMAPAEFQECDPQEST